MTLNLNQLKLQVWGWCEVLGSITSHTFRLLVNKMIKPRKCLECEKLFTPAKGHHGMELCSEKCRKKRQRKLQNKKRVIYRKKFLQKQKEEWNKGIVWVWDETQPDGWRKEIRGD